MYFDWCHDTVPQIRNYNFIPSLKLGGGGGNFVAYSKGRIHIEDIWTRMLENYGMTNLIASFHKISSGDQIMEDKMGQTSYLTIRRTGKL
jgi:hypothetical protein